MQSKSNYQFHSQIRHQFQDFIFTSQFDTGNLQKVEKNYKQANSFNLWISPDCYNTKFENNHRTWFYFRLISKIKFNDQIFFTIKNMNYQGKLFKEGLVPVFREYKEMNNSIEDWRRINSTVRVSYIEKGIEINFSQYISCESNQLFEFAFTYPWSFSDNQVEIYQNIIIFLIKAFLDELYLKFQDHQNIFFHKEILGYSLDHNEIQIIMLTSKKNIKQKFIDKNEFPAEMFPLRNYNQKQLEQNQFKINNINNNFSFPNKKCIFISARVHPGEVPSSHVFNGIIDFMLQENNEQATSLLDNFFFLMVPMLNPDGVIRGHYRTDSLGQNLNRCYQIPNYKLQPSIYLVKKLLLLLHYQEKLAMYIDLHAHATKRGTFVFGNSLEFQKHVQSCLFAKILSINSEIFDYDSSNFTEKNMVKKEGSGRVAIYRATGISNCYTLECNYNSGINRYQVEDKCQLESKIGNKNQQVLTVKQIEEYILTRKYQEKLEQKPYSLLDLKKLGHSICETILDYFDLNSYSRIPNSIFHSYETLKLNLAYFILKEQPYKYESCERKFIQNLEKINTRIEAFKEFRLYLCKTKKLRPKNIIQRSQSQQQNIKSISNQQKRNSIYIKQQQLNNIINNHETQEDKLKQKSFDDSSCGEKDIEQVLNKQDSILIEDDNINIKQKIINIKEDQVNKKEYLFRIKNEKENKKQPQLLRHQISAKNLNFNINFIPNINNNNKKIIMQNQYQNLLNLPNLLQNQISKQINNNISSSIKSINDFNKVSNQVIFNIENKKNNIINITYKKQQQIKEIIKSLQPKENMREQKKQIFQ